MTTGDKAEQDPDDRVLKSEEVDRVHAELRRHIGHKVYLYTYGFGVGDPEVVLTCETCDGAEIVDLTAHIR